MAVLLKKYVEGQKGIILFTHKEYFNFIFKKKKSKIFFFPKKLNQKRINLFLGLKEKYFVGVHFGWLFKCQNNYLEKVDFVMASDSILDDSILDDKNYSKIPLLSRNFIPDELIKFSKERRDIDILCVSNNSKKKNLDKLLHIVRTIYNKGIPLKVLLICPKRMNEDSNEKFYHDLEQEYYKNFTFDERQSFILFRPQWYNGFSGIPHFFLKNFYQSAKVFVLFSEVEGGSKVISEALLSGLIVCAYKNLKGGGLDYIHKKDYLFDEGTEVETILKAVENFNEYIPDSEFLYANLTESQSLESLKSYFNKLYQENGLEFDNLLDVNKNLHLKIPAHTLEDMPWIKNSNLTSDILDDETFNVFLNYLR